LSEPLASLKSATLKSARIRSTTTLDCINASRERPSIARSISGSIIKNPRYPERELEDAIMRTPAFRPSADSTRAKSLHRSLIEP
jgi:hypothetical protein